MMKEGTVRLSKVESLCEWGEEHQDVRETTKELVLTRKKDEVEAALVQKNEVKKMTGEMMCL